MGTVTRGTKAAGGTAFVDDTTAEAAEVNTDFDTLYTLVNGNIDSDNISASANIPNSALVEIDGTKVSDHSDNAATAATTSTMGDSSTLGANLPTDLEEEIEGLRFNSARAKGWNGTIQYMDGAGSMQDVEWVEEPMMGPNLLVNSGFEDDSLTSGDVPPGWTEVGTLAASGNENAPDVNGTHARDFRFLTDASGEGLKQTVEGLKVSTKYVFGVTYYLTTGGVSFLTNGGLGSSNEYQDPTYTDTTTGAGTKTVQVIVKTDSSGTDIDFEIQGTTSSSDINVVEAWVRELREDKPAEIPTGFTQTASHSTEVTNLPTTFDTSWDSNWTEDTTLTLSTYVPGPGYALDFDAQIQWATESDSTATEDTVFHYGFRLVRNDSGGDTVVDGPYFVSHDQHGSTDVRRSGVIRLTDRFDTPTPGETYEYSYEVTAYNSSGTDTRPRLHPLINPTVTGVVTNDTIQSTSRSRLRLERI